MENKNIAIITTVINWNLYKRSSLYFPDFANRYVIDGTKGMYGLESIFYMMKKLKDSQIEWLIMADEDVLFVNPEGIHCIINQMERENYLVCGARDGGAIEIRNHNPNAINTFFSIINFKRLIEIWDKKEIEKNHYIKENEFDDCIQKSSIAFDTMSLFEPYYCFYFWMKRKGEKILYLNVDTPFEDAITTSVFDTNNNLLLYHTWYARLYGKDLEQTKRIDEIFNLIVPNENKYKEPIFLQHKFFFLKIFYKNQKRRFNKVINLICNK